MDFRYLNDSLFQLGDDFVPRNHLLINTSGDIISNEGKKEGRTTNVVPRFHGEAVPLLPDVHC